MIRKNEAKEITFATFDFGECKVERSFYVSHLFAYSLYIQFPWNARSSDFWMQFLKSDKIHLEIPWFSASFRTHRIAKVLSQPLPRTHPLRITNDLYLSKVQTFLHDVMMNIKCTSKVNKRPSTSSWSLSKEASSTLLLKCNFKLNKLVLLKKFVCQFIYILFPLFVSLKIIFTHI